MTMARVGIKSLSESTPVAVPKETLVFGFPKKSLLATYTFISSHIPSHCLFPLFS